MLTGCPAPAKLNLFLHVVGRRPDGYHLLQSMFQLIDRADLLDFRLRDDGAIRRVTDVPGVPEDADLVVRAARLLQAEAGRPLSGVDIALVKRLPLGGGLGGGSSDAATTLIALNRLWDLGFDRARLAALGLRLGADVPFFLFGSNAFVEGIGEAMTPVETPDCWFVVVEPGLAVPTAAIFGAPELTRDTKPVRITDFSGSAAGFKTGFGRNDLQDVAVSRFEAIAQALEWLKRYGDARMTGSGACVFCPFGREAEADAALAALPPRWKGWKARALQRHPLAHWLTR
ncbi:MAG: 4-(cytidine 5'-diphospho)-2-C-methyl-D-erythritol kinase [Burkholderiaceae bacterium]